MSKLIFYVCTPPYSKRTVPEELSGDYYTWWDAHNTMMDYCTENGISPSEFWIEEIEQED